MARMRAGSFLLENGITCTGTAIQSKNTVEKGNGITGDWALVKIWTGKWYQQAVSISKQYLLFSASFVCLAACILNFPMTSTFVKKPFRMVLNKCT